jgi:hypothetical protein
MQPELKELLRRGLVIMMARSVDALFEGEKTMLALSVNSPIVLDRYRNVVSLAEKDPQAEFTEEEWLMVVAPLTVVFDAPDRKAQNDED